MADADNEEALTQLTAEALIPALQHGADSGMTLPLTIAAVTGPVRIFLFEKRGIAELKPAEIVSPHPTAPTVTLIMVDRKGRVERVFINRRGDISFN
jgi:hypothetical protein